MAIKINIAFKVKITQYGLQEGGYFRFIDFGISSANLEKTASQLAFDWNHRDEPYFYKDLFSSSSKSFKIVPLKLCFKIICFIQIQMAISS